MYFILLGLLLCSVPRQGSAKLLLVYYLHRHGARNILPKSSLLSESNATGGPALLPVGLQQLQRAGAAFRVRYLSSATCGRTNTCLGGDSELYGVLNQPGVGYNNYNTLIRSSGLDRTIASAESFTAGMFPPPSNASNIELQQTVPVYTTPDNEDWLIRAYTKCPTYNRRLQEWYSSSEFKQREEQSAPLRNSIAALNPQMNVSLANWWNVYDMYNTYQTFGFGGPLSILENKTFGEVVELARWLESTKMQNRFTAGVLGGSILADLLNYMEAAGNAPASGVYYKLMGLSAHYNTLMVTPSALKLDQSASYPWAKSFPEMGAVLAYELHTDASGSKAVRLVYQADPASSYQTITLPCAKAGSPAESVAGEGACSYVEFVSLAQPAALTSAAAWCGACKNKDTSACQLVSAAQEKEALMEQVKSRDGSSKFSSEAVLAIGILAAVAAVALIATIVLAVMLRRARRPHTSFMDQASPML